MKFPIRKEVEKFSPYEAGLSIDEIKQKNNLAHVIKLASNENPLGTSQSVIKTLKEKAHLAFRYPQSGNPRLAQAIAQKHNVDIKRIALGNGLDEVIDGLIRVLATSGVNNIVAFDPCFGIYTTQAHLCGVELRQVPLNKDFSFNLGELYKKIDRNTSIVFLTNPDNPSGYTITKEEIYNFALKIPKSTLLVVDEAYIDFADKEFCSEELIHNIENIAILRTFSKCYGLAGMRIGYGIFPEEVADYMGRIRLPFSISILGEEVALCALKDKDFYNKTVKVTKSGREYLTKEFKALSIDVASSQSNFILISLKTAELAKGLYTYLLEHGIIVRSLTSYKLPNSLRISIGLEEENNLLIKHTKEFLQWQNHL